MSRIFYAEQQVKTWKYMNRFDIFGGIFYQTLFVGTVTLIVSSLHTLASTELYHKLQRSQQITGEQQKRAAAGRPAVYSEVKQGCGKNALQ